jgi:UDP-glucuronate 4-epimerase
MKHTVLVTGAAGFIGSHVCEALIRRGDAVVGVDNLDPFYDPGVKRQNLAAIAQTARHGPGSFAFHECDIADAEALARVFEGAGPTGVIHLAAKAGVRPSIADPPGYARANVTGTSVVLEAARRAACSRLVMASSSSVYGDGAVVPFSESADAGEPVSPYAATKRACELIAYTHWHLTRMPTACLRFFTVFGPRQRPDLAIQMFLLKAARGLPVPVFGDGSTSRDYTFIDDIVEGVLASFDRIGSPEIPGRGYRVWNLGGNRPVRLDDMLAAIARVTAKPLTIERRPMQPGDVLRTWADLSRPAAELGYKPRVPFEEGLERQWAWVRQSGLA